MESFGLQEADPKIDEAHLGSGALCQTSIGGKIQIWPGEYTAQLSCLCTLCLCFLICKAVLFLFYLLRDWWQRSNEQIGVQVGADSQGYAAFLKGIVAIVKRTYRRGGGAFRWVWEGVLASCRNVRHGHFGNKE